MRTPFAVLLVIATIFGTGFWYTVLKNPCDIPVTYRIGSIDGRFGIGEDEVRLAALNAEKLWEEKIGSTILAYDASSDRTINLVYDERQEDTNAALHLLENLDETEHLSDSLSREYAKLLSEYEKLKLSYEERARTYEGNLADYNAEVLEWNEKKGAPKPVFEELERRKQTLFLEQTKLNALAKELNALVREMNTLGTRGGEVIEDYNKVAEEYNDRFGEDHEFTQGDYKDRTITVYQFTTNDELVLVLAHEFGHALTLDHVEGEESIMYRTMDAQTRELGVTEHDLAEFSARCSAREIPLIPFL